MVGLRFTTLAGATLRLLLSRDYSWPVTPALYFVRRSTQTLLRAQIRVKPGLYSVRLSTQTQLRKRVYPDTRVMWFILLRRSPRVFKAELRGSGLRTISERRIYVILAGWSSRCHELSLPLNWVCTGQSSDSERARDQWQCAAVTPQVNLSFSFVSCI